MPLLIQRMPKRDIKRHWGTKHCPLPSPTCTYRLLVAAPICSLRFVAARKSGSCKILFASVVWLTLPLGRLLEAELQYVESHRLDQALTQSGSAPLCVPRLSPKCWICETLICEIILIPRCLKGNSSGSYWASDMQIKRFSFLKELVVEIWSILSRARDK